MSLKVNGQTYGWGDVDVKIPGLVLVVQEISYDDEQEMEESYGKGYRPRGYGKGNYKASGKMSMLRDDYDDVLAYCKAKGIPFYGIEWPSVVVSYANEGERTRIDELKKVIPTKRSHKAAQGDKSLTVDIDLMIVGGIMEDMKKEVAGKSRAEEMKEKYGKVYRVGATIEVDDETEKTVEFYFKRPSTASYDRYVKTTAQGATKALKTFLFDNVVAESEADLEADLEEFPALALSIGEKLLGMLGLSKQTNLKML